MKRWKRALRHLIVFGLLGVVMSYALAWGLSICFRGRWNVGHTYEQFDLECVVWTIGWPSRSMRGVWNHPDFGGKSNDFVSVSLPTWKSGTRGEWMLPYRPLWPGLLLNTAFYGGILWLLWFGPGMIRRGVRRRRGLCVRCGYDLRGAANGAPCPECGDVSR